MDNAQIADRLDAFAGLLELGEANPYSARAYRRAAETIRAVPVPVEDLVRSGKVRELRGIGGSIEAKLRELAETGDIAELVELERELAPGIVGLGRYLGLGAKRSVELARALQAHTPEEFHEAAAAGRLRDVPGIGPKLESQLLEALAHAREPREERSIGFARARELVGAIAAALEGEAAGDVRRWHEAPSRLVVVRGAEEPGAVLDRFAALPQIVAVIEREERRAVGVTIEGVPVELLVPTPACAGTELLRATGSRAYVAALGPLPDGADEAAVYAALDAPAWPPELREGPVTGEPPALLEVADIRGDLHCHTTWSDGRASVEEMARAAIARGYAYIAICDHTPAVGAVPGLTPDDVRRQAGEIAAANELLAPFRVLRGIECDIRQDGTLDLPDDVLGRAGLGPGERPRRPADAAAGDDRACRARDAQPARELPEPSDGADDRAPPGERRRPRPRLRARARDRQGGGGQRPAGPARPQRGARARGARRGRADHLLDRRPLRARARQHAQRGAHRAPRRRHRG